MISHDEDQDEGEDDRVTSSLAALAVILLLAVVALVLMQRIGVATALQDCLLSGRTNCMPIDPGELNR